MRYLLAMLAIAACMATHGQSCCCTGTGSNYSILPNLNRHVIGVRYIHRNYYSETFSLNPEANGKITNQYMHSAEIFGRFNLIERLQLSAFIPVNFIKQKTHKETSSAQGLGDLSFLLQYNLLNPLKCNGSNAKHQLRLGIGTKLPSGDFTMNANDMFSTNLQRGSGSIDFLANVIYTVRFKNFGLNTTASYKLNTVNPQQYRFGNKAQGGVTAFYIFTVSHVQLMPSVGINYEHQALNIYKQKALDYTGGQFASTSIGFDVYYKQFAFASSVSPVLMNKLNWRGENRNRFNIEAGIFYNFSLNKN